MSGLKLAKGIKLTISLVVVICLMAAWFAVRQVNLLMEPVDPADRSIVELKIPDNSSTYHIADILAEKKLIKDERFFVLYCRARNYDAQMKAGLYQFSRSQELQEIINDLMTGRVATLEITVPEGFTLKQIGEMMVKQGICSDKEWAAAAAHDYDFAAIQHIPKRDNRLEGFLYPDTYRITKGATPEQIINLMLKRFEAVWNDRFAKSASHKGLSTYRVVTMASMVEREAMVGAERPRIAGVFYNRLKIGMPLQVDATILYSLGEHKDRVLYKDLEIESPYNTYKYGGLPLGPISSPGAASIEAALNPEHHDYYYYVATGTGAHYFSRTIEEHNRAKAKYIK